MAKHLVLVGGGHAHMMTLANIHAFVGKGHRVTVIGPSEHHYYSGMGPGMLGGTYSPSDIRFATKHVVEKQGGVFVLGKAVRVRPDERRIELESGETVSYDVVSFNAGSYVPRLNLSEDTENIYPVKPIERLIESSSQNQGTGFTKTHHYRYYRWRTFFRGDCGEYLAIDIRVWRKPTPCKNFCRQWGSYGQISRRE